MRFQGTLSVDWGVGRQVWGFVGAVVEATETNPLTVVEPQVEVSTGLASSQVSPAWLPSPVSPDDLPSVCETPSPIS